MGDFIEISGVQLHGFVPVIGLEIHAQIAAREKLFSRASAMVFGQNPNSCVSFVDGAFPGMLPVVNPACIRHAIKLGLALGGTISPVSIFERKHYLYPDNPSGYQISQFQMPLVLGGCVPIETQAKGSRVIELERIHVEQDAGKSIHDVSETDSLLDLNRAGVGLMEIVSKPQLHHPDEVVAYVKRLRCVMRALGVCHGDMEKGQLRVDVNVSVHKPGTPLGTRIEIKNMNSFSFLHQALIYEIQRQVNCLLSGGSLRQETRLFHVPSGETRFMRTKEEASDYFYFPDPDLPPLVVSAQELADIAKEIPPLPWELAAQWVERHGLSTYEANVLTEDSDVATYFQSILTHLPNKDHHRLAANWVMGEVFALLKRQNQAMEDFSVSPENMARLVQHTGDKTLSSSMAKEIFAVMVESGQGSEKGPDAIMTERGMVQVSDVETIQGWIHAVLAASPQQLADYLAGKEKLAAYFVGMVMKASKGKANPELVQKLLGEALHRRKEGAHSVTV